MGFRRTFITGLVVVLPLMLTFWLVSLLFGMVDGTVTPVLTSFVRLVAPEAWLQRAWVTYVAPLVSIALAVFTIYLIGLVGGNVLGRQLLRWGEAILLRIPVVRPIYSAAKQFVDTFSHSDGKSFSSVVLVEFPREGVWTLGFVTGTTRGEVAARTRRSLLTVFVPTSPNPTGGYVLFVPEDKVIRLEMTVDDALKVVITGGVLAPDTAVADLPGASTHPG